MNIFYLFWWLLVVSLPLLPSFPIPTLPSAFSHIITANLHGCSYNTSILKLRKWWKEWIRPSSSDQGFWQSRKSEILKVQVPEISTWIEVDILSHFSLKNSGFVDFHHSWGLCLSGMLHSICWYCSDVSEWLISPIFKGQLTPRMGLIGCPKMSVNNYQHMVHNIPEGFKSSTAVTEPWNIET